MWVFFIFIAPEKLQVVEFSSRSSHLFIKLWGELFLRDWLKKTPHDLMQIWFPKFSETVLKRSIVPSRWLMEWEFCCVHDDSLKVHTKCPLGDPKQVLSWLLPCIIDYRSCKCVLLWKIMWVYAILIYIVTQQDAQPCLAWIIIISLSKLDANIKGTAHPWSYHTKSITV